MYRPALAWIAILTAIAPNSAVAEAWYCYEKQKFGVDTVLHFESANGVLTEDTGETMLRGWIPDYKGFLGETWSIVRDDADALVASSSYSAKDAAEREIPGITSIVIDKGKGAFRRLTFTMDQREPQISGGPCRLAAHSR